MLNKKLIVTLLLFSIGCFNNKKDTLTRKEKMKPSARAAHEVFESFNRTLEMADYAAFEEIIKKYPFFIDFLKQKASEILVLEIKIFGIIHYNTAKSENAHKILVRTLELFKESKLLNKSNLIPVFSFLTRCGNDDIILNEEFCVLMLRLIDRYISPDVYQEIVENLTFEGLTGEIINSPALASAFLYLNWKVCTFFIEKEIGINYYNPILGTVFFSALVAAKADVINLLLRKGAKLLVPANLVILFTGLVSSFKIDTISDEARAKLVELTSSSDQKVSQDKKELIKRAKDSRDYFKGKTLDICIADAIEKASRSMHIDPALLTEYISSLFRAAFLEPVLDNDFLVIKLLEKSFLIKKKKSVEATVKGNLYKELKYPFIVARQPTNNDEIYFMKNDLSFKLAFRETLTEVNEVGQDVLTIAFHSRNVYFLPTILKIGIIDREWIRRYRNKVGMNLLSYIASKYTSEDMAEVCEEWANAILNEGVDINQLGDNGFSALHYACYVGSLNMVRLLINRRADTEVKDKNGRTAIHIAAREGHSEIVNLLISSGARLTEKRMMVDGKEVITYKELEIAEKKLKELMDKSGVGVIDEKVKEYQKIILTLQNVLLSVD